MYVYKGTNSTAWFNFTWTTKGIPSGEKDLREFFLSGLIVEARMAGQTGKSLHPSQDLILYLDEIISILLSSQSITHNGDGGKVFMG